MSYENMSPADYAAITRNNDGGFGGFGGDGAWWIIILLLFGWGGRGFGGGFGGQSYGGCGVPATQADLAAGFNNSAVLSGINGIDSALCQGFNGLNTAFLQGVNGLERQIADCCCESQRLVERGFAETNYNLATQACETRNTIQNTTRDIIDNANANSRAILDFLTQDKIATLTAENQSLRLSASQANQNAVLMAAMDANKAEILRRTGAECPTAAYIVNAPTPVRFPLNSCGQVQFGGGTCGCSGFGA
ncbi:MAG: hypothetical protein U0L88_04910 [Acutalibacteraceae bacterium]|nr:hypothetical protein [Acutalibacteraceae bacterium]